MEPEHVTDGAWRVRVPGGWLYVVSNEGWCINNRPMDAAPLVPSIGCAFVPVPRIDILSALTEAQAEVDALIEHEREGARSASKMGEALTHQGYASGLERAMELVLDRVKRVT